MLRNGETSDWIGTFDGHKDASELRVLTVQRYVRPQLLRISALGCAFVIGRVWDALTGDELQGFEHKHIVGTCAFSESTTFLLTGGAEKKLRIFDLNRPDALPTEIDASGTLRASSAASEAIYTKCLLKNCSIYTDLNPNKSISPMVYGHYRKCCH